IPLLDLAAVRGRSAREIEALLAVDRLDPVRIAVHVDHPLLVRHGQVVPQVGGSPVVHPRLRDPKDLVESELAADADRPAQRRPGRDDDSLGRGALDVGNEREDGKYKGEAEPSANVGSNVGSHGEVLLAGRPGSPETVGKSRPAAAVSWKTGRGPCCRVA